MTNKTVKINLETYLNIRRLIPALSKDTTRQALLNFGYDAKNKRVVATDAFIMLWTDRKIDFGEKDFVFEPTAFKPNSKAIQDLYYGGNKPAFCTEPIDFGIWAKEDFKYPNYTQLVPTGPAKGFPMLTLDFVLLARLEKCLAIFGKDGTQKAYTLVFSDNEKHPIRIYKGKTLIGILMPCRMLEDDMPDVKIANETLKEKE